MTRPSFDLPRKIRHRAHRASTDLHVLEGVPAFIHACDAGVEFEALYHCNILLRSATAQKLVRHRKREGVPTLHLTPKEFRQVSADTRASGILAVAQQRWTLLSDLPFHASATLLVLESIRSPGNLGTLLRTAEAASVAGVAFLGPDCDPYDVSVVRPSMGSVFDLRLVRTTHADLRRWASERSVTIVGTSLQATHDHTSLRRAGPTAILLGDEREGLSEQARRLCDDAVRIPILGRSDSLNVAVAAGIVLHELLSARRQES